MGSKRTPIIRRGRLRFTPEALEAFRQMRALPFEGERWWKLHSILGEELQMKPWEYPCIKCPDPAQPAVHDSSKAWDDVDAENLYRELDRCLSARKM